ncbi:MAG: Crp/Fnr family transcriptional regulator [Clostridia bacterium]|nr:Crp/Fnr family transcriptional regulator [Clostridia bacterium]
MANIMHNPLFRGLDPKDCQRALDLWQARTLKLAKDEILVSAGNPVTHIYVVLSGSLAIVTDDYWGNRSLLSTVKRNGLFGAAYAFGDADIYPLTVYASEDTELLSLSPAALSRNAYQSPSLYQRIQANVVATLANKAIGLIHTIEQVKQRSLRNKILAYLANQAHLAGAMSFEIPLDRQQLADYLAVDRTALSRELSRLKDEGLLDYHKNKFTLFGNQ